MSPRRHAIERRAPPREPLASAENRERERPHDGPSRPGRRREEENNRRHQHQRRPAMPPAQRARSARLTESVPYGDQKSSGSGVSGALETERCADRPRGAGHAPGGCGVAADRKAVIGAEMPIDATTTPSSSRIGAATHRTSSTSSPSSIANPRVLFRVQTFASSAPIRWSVRCGTGASSCRTGPSARRGPDPRQRFPVRRTVQRDQSPVWPRTVTTRLVGAQ